MRSKAESEDDEGSSAIRVVEYEMSIDDHNLKGRCKRRRRLVVIVGSGL